jgi:hypothetical protein
LLRKSAPTRQSFHWSYPRDHARTKACTSDGVVSDRIQSDDFYASLLSRGVPFGDVEEKFPLFIIFSPFDAFVANCEGLRPGVLLRIQPRIEILSHYYCYRRTASHGIPVPAIETVEARY